VDSSPAKQDRLSAAHSASTAERNAARSAKNYALADQIRDELAR
jgi:cysteinyl-tRNA synthetase